MHNDIAGMLSNLQEQRERLAEATKAMREVTANATTKDRMVKATVDTRGRLTELTFSGNRWRDLAPRELGTKVLEVITRAQDKAEKAVIELAGPVTPGGVDLKKFMKEGPDFDEILADFKSPGDDRGEERSG
ncbi:YbaB/EbfC family nucleoid-associated protein [Amycolatopsis pigmentata]|uniref:YbaB/EbfC family nucleoid-associated protein n=1 Tax=Amycolatopsis pigmentata TaxID=450801 RepID=A0ABW5FP02_9PSEU